MLLHFVARQAQILIDCHRGFKRQAKLGRDFLQVIGALRNFIAQRLRRVEPQIQILQLARKPQFAFAKVCKLFEFFIADIALALARFSIATSSRASLFKRRVALTTAPKS